MTKEEEPTVRSLPLRGKSSKSRIWVGASLAGAGVGMPFLASLADAEVGNQKSGIKSPQLTSLWAKRASIMALMHASAHHS